jgi:hypothetical protein
MRFLHFMGEGGWAMWFVLPLGLVTLAVATAFAREPGPKRRDAVRSLSLATSFVIMSALALNLAAVGSKVPNIPELANHPRLELIVMQGIAESLAPAILGFALLSLAWLIAAIGDRRPSRALPER